MEDFYDGCFKVSTAEATSSDDENYGKNPFLQNRDSHFYNRNSKATSGGLNAHANYNLPPSIGEDVDSLMYVLNQQDFVFDNNDFIEPVDGAADEKEQMF